jgi:arylamine N-acetyltransferase
MALDFLPSRRVGAAVRVHRATAAEVIEALRDRFGIDLTGLRDVEERVSEVLDNWDN